MIAVAPGVLDVSTGVPLVKVNRPPDGAAEFAKAGCWLNVQMPSPGLSWRT